MQVLKFLIIVILFVINTSNHICEGIFDFSEILVNTFFNKVLLFSYLPRKLAHILKLSG